MLLPRPQRKTTGRGALVAVLTIAITAAVHGLFLALVVISSLFKLDVKDRPRTLNQPRSVTLRGLTSDQFEKNRGPAAKTRDERKQVAKTDRPELEKKPPEKPPEGQIVDVAPGNNQVDPNSKFVAETNNAVKKETRAREQSPNYRNAMPQRTAPQKVDGNGTAQSEKAQVSGNNGMGDDDRPLKEAAAPKLAMQVPDLKKRQEIALKKSDTVGPGVAVSNRDESQEVKGNSNRLNLVPGARDQGEDVSAGRIGQAGVLNLLPSAAVVDKITGAAPNDHLKDVDEGDGTYLSTREWKYASFFNRVKQSVSQEWAPTDQLRLRDPTGQIYGGRDRYTILTVTLDGTGRMKDAFVDKSSGLDFLDLEAVKAFERAQPFPNPPPAILATDQTVRFQFGFYLELSGRPGMRLFRSTQ